MRVTCDPSLRRICRVAYRGPEHGLAAREDLHNEAAPVKFGRGASAETGWDVLSISGGSSVYTAKVANVSTHRAPVMD